jgi:hypothetical protein
MIDRENKLQNNINKDKLFKYRKRKAKSESLIKYSKILSLCFEVHIKREQIKWTDS